MKHKPKFLGQKLVQKDLANTLRLISKKGKDGFYKGVTAKKISEQNLRETQRRYPHIA